MKVAILHEMLVKLGGAENVVKDFLDIYPDADLYTLIYDEKKVEKLFPKSIIKETPKITQKIYKYTKNQRFCLPFMARAVESIDLSSYDLVISSSSGFAHGCITKPETLHLVYYHSPARYLWDYTNEYKKDIGFSSGIKSYILNKFFLKAREWDYIAGQRHDISISASKQVSKRVSKYYRRDSEVIYPSVYIDNFEIGEIPLKDRKYYVITSALTEFKKVEIAVKSFGAIDYDLYIFGEGNYRKELEKIAPSNVKFFGRKEHSEICEYYKEARGFIMCGRDDFGIAPIEAMASGIPVFALNEGGLTETNVKGITGDFFDNSKGADFIEKFQIFDENINKDLFDPQKIRDHSMLFSKNRFVSEINNLVEKYI